MSLEEKQKELKEKQINPIRNTKKESTGFTYVLVFLHLGKLIKVSTKTTLEFRANNGVSGVALTFDSLEIFPFKSPELAKAFEKKVRYFYGSQNSI